MGSYILGLTGRVAPLSFLFLLGSDGSFVSTIPKYVYPFSFLTKLVLNLSEDLSERLWTLMLLVTLSIAVKTDPKAVLLLVHLSDGTAVISISPWGEHSSSEFLSLSSLESLSDCTWAALALISPHLLAFSSFLSLSLSLCFW